MGKEKKNGGKNAHTLICSLISLRTVGIEGSSQNTPAVVPSAYVDNSAMLSQTLPLCNSYLNNFRGDTNSMKLFAKHTDCSQHSHECCNSPNTMKSISISHTLSLRESDSQAISPHPHFFFFFNLLFCGSLFPFHMKVLPCFWTNGIYNFPWESNELQ